MQRLRRADTAAATRGGYFDDVRHRCQRVRRISRQCSNWSPPPGDTAKVELKAFDADGNQVGATDTATVTVGDPFAQLSVSDPSDQPDIAYFEVTQVFANPREPTPAPIGIDDIGITRSSTPPPRELLARLRRQRRRCDRQPGLEHRGADSPPGQRLGRRDRHERRRHALGHDLELHREPGDRDRRGTPR